MALALVLAMILTTLGGYAPTWFSAFAEDAAAQPETAPVDDPASDQEEETPVANDASPEGEASGEETSEAVGPSPANEVSGSGEGGATAPEEVVPPRNRSLISRRRGRRPLQSRLTPSQLPLKGKP